MHKIYPRITAALLASLLLAGCISNQAKHAAEHVEPAFSLPQVDILSPEARTQFMRDIQGKTPEQMVAMATPPAHFEDFAALPDQTVRTIWVEDLTTQDLLGLGFAPRQRLVEEFARQGFAPADSRESADATILIHPAMIGLTEKKAERLKYWDLISVTSPINPWVSFWWCFPADVLNFLVEKSIAQKYSVDVIATTTRFELRLRGKGEGPSFWTTLAGVQTNQDFSKTGQLYATFTAATAAEALADFFSYVKKEPRDRQTDFLALERSERQKVGI